MRNLCGLIINKLNDKNHKIRNHVFVSFFIFYLLKSIIVLEISLQC